MFKKSKKQQTNVDIEWIDYIKTDDIILQTWIIDCLKI